MAAGAAVVEEHPVAVASPVAGTAAGVEAPLILVSFVVDAVVVAAVGMAGTVAASGVHHLTFHRSYS